MPYLGQIQGDKIYTIEGWKPLAGEGRFEPYTYGPGPYDGGDGATDEEPQLNPFGGQPLPPGFPSMPQPEEFYIYDMSGSMVDPGTGEYLEAVDRWYDMAANYAEYGEEGFDGAGRAGPTPEELAIERSKVHAQNLATYLDAVEGKLGLEVESGRLRLDQAIAEFNRRMDAFEQGGEQMAEMWQWTVPPGTETIHTTLRENLGMEPWQSQAVEFDPFAMAWSIMEQSPEVLVEAPSLDPLNAALSMMEQFV